MRPLDLIETLQNKPEHHRKAIAVFIVIVLMLLILGVWMFTLTIAPEKDPAAVSDQPSPIQLLWNFAKESVK